MFTALSMFPSRAGATKDANATNRGGRPGGALLLRVF